MEYPLYDSLSEMEIDADYKVSFLHHVPSLNLEQRKTIYSLILNYFFQDHDISESAPIPYGCSVMYGGKGLLANLDNLPPKLCHILYNYVKSIKG